MIDAAIEFLQELRENWDDHYWWARNWHVQIIAMALLSGLIGLLFARLEEGIHPTRGLAA